MSCLTSYADKEAFTPKTAIQWVKSMAIWFDNETKAIEHFDFKNKE